MSSKLLHPDQSGDMWGITTYFNPAGYGNKISNFGIFSGRIRKQGIKLLVIELARNDVPFVLGTSTADKLIQVRSDVILWQKERLLNIALQELPQDCTKVVWLDADVIFENDHWAQETSDLLDRYMVVQPFEEAWWLSADCSRAITLLNESLLPELIAQWHRFSENHRYGIVRDPLGPNRTKLTGHTGFAWASRLSLVADGLYDKMIMNGGDVIIACAALGYSQEPYASKLLHEFCTRAHALDILSWMQDFCRKVKGSVAFTPGTLYHLWHGALQDRQYREGLSILKKYNFDPNLDIILDSNHCWKWGTDKPDLHREVRQYFWNRNEDAIASGLNTEPVSE